MLEPSAASEIKTFEKEKTEKEVSLNIILDESIEVQNKVDVLVSNAITGLSLVIIFLFIFLPWKIGIYSTQVRYGVK